MDLLEKGAPQKTAFKKPLLCQVEEENACIHAEEAATSSGYGRKRPVVIEFYCKLHSRAIKG